MPVPLAPKLAAKELATLNGPLRAAEAALARLDLAGEMIPPLNWFLYAFVRKEALLSSEIEGSQATPVDVPPPPECVADLLGDVELYIHADDGLAPLLRIALVHVQFETIHPYLDGNGRLGRMLIGVAEITDDSTQTARNLYARECGNRKTLLATSGATVKALQLFEKIPENPVITMPLVTRLLSTTKPTAGKAIDVLINAGLLVEVGERKRDRLYPYSHYLRLLN